MFQTYSCLIILMTRSACLHSSFILLSVLPTPLLPLPCCLDFFLHSIPLPPLPLDPLLRNREWPGTLVDIDEILISALPKIPTEYPSLAVDCSQDRTWLSLPRAGPHFRFRELYSWIAPSPLTGETSLNKETRRAQRRFCFPVASRSILSTFRTSVNSLPWRWSPQPSRGPTQITEGGWRRITATSARRRTLLSSSKHVALASCPAYRDDCPRKNAN